MNKEEIIELLEKNHASFFQFINILPEDIFHQSRNEKWSPYQNTDHITRALQPLVLAYNLPKFLIALIVGKSNRPSKTYEGLVNKYKDKLGAGGKASGRYIPKEHLSKTQRKETERTQKILHKLLSAVRRKWSEKDLDTYIFPHPLLGKITAREMLYFTAYHVAHHEALVQNYYGS